MWEGLSRDGGDLVRDPMEIFTILLQELPLLVVHLVTYLAESEPIPVRDVLSRRCRNEHAIMSVEIMHPYDLFLLGLSCEWNEHGEPHKLGIGITVFTIQEVGHEIGLRVNTQCALDRSAKNRSSLFARELNTHHAPRLAGHDLL